MSKQRMYRCFKYGSSFLGLYHVYASVGRMLCKGEKKALFVHLSSSVFLEEMAFELAWYSKLNRMVFLLMFQEL